MKKTILAVFLLLMIPLASAAGTLFEDSNLKITILRSDPSPATAGDYLDLYLRVEAQYDSDLDYTFKNLDIEVLPEYPFSLDASEEAIKEIGELKEGEIVDIKYRLKVATEVVEGENEIKFRAISDKGIQTSGPLYIEIKPKTAILNVIDTQTFPSPIEPGKESQIIVTIQNTAGVLMRDVSLKLDLSLDLLQSGALTTQLRDQIPLAPIGSSTEKRVATINPGDKAEFVYDVMAYPDAEAKVYKVPIVLSYRDRSGANYTKEDVVGLVVGSEPDLYGIVDSSEIYSKGQTGEVTLKFVNKGVTDVKFLNVKLLDSEYYHKLSAPEVYIGNVDSDDYETADYLIKVKKTEGGTTPLKVELEYKDANNKDYLETITIPLYVYSKSELGIPTKSNLIPNLILLAIIYFVTYWIWKRKNRNKKIKDYNIYLKEKATTIIRKVKRRFKKK